MNIFLQLASTAILPVIVSAALYLLEKKTKFGNFNKWIRAVIAGIAFGILAIMGTEFGVDITGAVVNTRDASVLAAGLIFGAPAGILAGIIGGVERYLAVYWGAGAYTRIACSVSTILAGFIGAGLRKFLFENKKPSTLYALAIGLLTEVLHMMMVFFTNMSDVTQAFNFVEQSALPMILINGISVMLSVFVVTLIGKEDIKKSYTTKRITSVFQRWLLVCVVVAFLFSSIFIGVLQDKISENNSSELLKLNIDDVVADILDASDENLLELTHLVAKEFQNGNDIREIAKNHSIAEINVMDKNGIIVDSTQEEFLNYNMADGEQSSEFLSLLNGKNEVVQRYQPTSFDENIHRKYAGVVLDKGGFIQVGYDAEQFQKDIDDLVVGATENRHVGQNGCIIIADENWNIVSDRHNNEGQNLDVTGIWIDRATMAENTRFETTIYGEESYFMYVNTEGYYIVSVMTKQEALFARNISIYITMFIEILVFVILFMLVYLLVKKLVVNNIRKINDSLAEITGGNLDVVVDVRSNEEFASLSDDINSTVVTLKHYIDEAAARIDEELHFARSIQHSALPAVFPPFPERKEFNIYAQMDTAKEVGGDFYDFYFVGNNKLAFLIADVSGKGIPAAMFMMTAKTLIKGFAESGKSVNETFTLANNELCKNNDTGMFVTAWMGIIDLKTGIIEYTNAGHNPPIVMHRDGTYEYLKARHGFILAGMEDVNYRKSTAELQQGDKIYLYTDGVTEATDAHDELYGEERLEKVLKSNVNSSVTEICEKIKIDIDVFAGDAPQFDDITMLCLEYNGNGEKSMTVDISLDELSQLTEFVETTLNEKGVSMQTVIKMNIALDEIFSNIVKFSNATYAKVSCGVEENMVFLKFEDDGIPYNPMDKEDADITLNAEERDIGGLGILMVKKSMDIMSYSYEDSKNILILKKTL